jgi:hypothetical protein
MDQGTLKITFAVWKDHSSNSPRISSDDGAARNIIQTDLLLQHFHRGVLRDESFAGSSAVACNLIPQDSVSVADRFRPFPVRAIGTPVSSNNSQEGRGGGGALSN